jgi:hypothetical protein
MQIRIQYRAYAQSRPVIQAWEERIGATKMAFCRNELKRLREAEPVRKRKAQEQDGSNAKKPATGLVFLSSLIWVAFHVLSCKLAVQAGASKAPVERKRALEGFSTPV